MTSTKPETASQTAGPYVHIGCAPNFSGVEGVYSKDLGNKLNFPTENNEAIFIQGSVFDGDGKPLLDAMVEIWQAGSDGTYTQTRKAPMGWGRCASNMETGEFKFKTVKPGQVDYNGKLQAPHISFFIVARGINKGLHTRMYFTDEAAKNNVDPLLLHIQNKDQISTLMAKQIKDDVYQFDIHLQGSNETVFLDI